MRFVNEGKAVQVRVGNWPVGLSWVLLQKGETIDLPEDLGLRYGLEKVSNGVQKLPKVTEGKIGSTKVETKQFENDYKRKLVLIKGISSKTAKDIIKVYPTDGELMSAILHDEDLPFRDDIEKKLRKEYGK